MSDKEPMDIYIYSDESGVFDKEHNDWFVFGGVIFLSKENKDTAARLYTKAERDIRNRNKFSKDQEIKATAVSNTDKTKLYRAANKFYKFAAVVDQRKVLDRIYIGKKDKQRYLDYVYKIAVKRSLESLIKSGEIDPDNVRNIIFFVDEHTTATNGRYELQEALEQELKNGTFNYNYSVFHPPLFPKMSGSVTVRYCNSENKTLVRTADIVANRIYYLTRTGSAIKTDEYGPFITKFP